MGIGNKVNYLSLDGAPSLGVSGFYNPKNKYFETGFNFNGNIDLGPGFGAIDARAYMGASEQGETKHNNSGLDVNLSYNLEHNFGYLSAGAGVGIGYGETYTGGDTNVEQSWGSYYDKYITKDGAPAIGMASGPVFVKTTEPKNVLEKGISITPTVSAEAGIFAGEGLVGVAAAAGKDTKSGDKFATVYGKVEYPIYLAGSVFAKGGYTWNDNNQSTNWGIHKGPGFEIGASLNF